MDNSATFLAYMELLKAGWLRHHSLDLAKTLDMLEERGLITTREHEDLLDLAKKIRTEVSSGKSS